MGFEDVFAGISFDDATINLSGDAGSDGGNAGTPPPVDAGKTDANLGQTPASPAGPEGQDAGQKAPVDDKGAKPKEEGSTGDTKPLPFDQDPKWKKARAAEKQLQDILDAHGFLSAEELMEGLKQGQELSKLVGHKDAKKLLEDADYLAKVRQHWSKEENAKKFENETPDERSTRLEKELQTKTKEFEDYRSHVEDTTKAREVIDNFSKEVSKVVTTKGEEMPFSNEEQQLLTLYLGVDNPANMIDIEDRTAVRKMASEGITKFQTLVQTIKQKAIDDYVSGKKDKVVDTSRASDTIKGKETVDKSTQKPVTNTNTPASIDAVFDAANRELMEVLLQGAKSLT